LNGVYLRNGPNPKQKIEGKYHWFDGDGMIHSIRIKDGELYYSNRYLRTERFKIEESRKKSVFIKIGDMEGFKGLLKIMFAKVKEMIWYDPKLDELKNGTSNTSLLNYN
jgi:carotenoid cleavage dioxygenase